MTSAGSPAMISSSRIKKLFAYLAPHLGKKTKAELDAVYRDMERILGYDAAKAARYRKDAKDRDGVIETLMGISLADGISVANKMATGSVAATDSSRLIEI